MFFSRFYRPDRATVLVAGDVDPDEVFALIEEHYSGWEPSTGTVAPLPAEPPQTAPRRAQIDWDSPTAPRLAMGWKIPAHDAANPDVANLELAANLLLSYIGPLYRRLVEGEELAYDVSGARDDFVDPGLFRVFVTLRDAGDLEAVEAIVLEEVEALKTAVDADVLDRTRSHVRYSFLTGLDNPGSVASQLGWYDRRGGPTAIDDLWAAVDEVTADGLADAVSRHLRPEHLTVVTLSPPAAEEAP